MSSLEEQLLLRRQLIFSKVTEKIGPTLHEDSIASLKIRVACFVYKKDGSDRHWKDLLQALTDTPHPQHRVIQQNDDNAENGQKSPHLLHSKGIQFECIQFDRYDIGKGDLISKQMHVVFCGGGLAPEHASYLGSQGRAEIVKFLEMGGGYVGCCAGAYLACTPSESSLNFWNFSLIDYHILDLDNWDRGMGLCQCENTAQGNEMMQGNLNTTLRKVYYRNGPLFTPVTDENLRKKYSQDKIKNSTIWQYFKQEFTKDKNSQKQSLTMMDTPSIIANEYGKGKVVVFSAHPEASEVEIRNEFKCAFIWASSQLIY